MQVRITSNLTIWLLGSAAILSCLTIVLTNIRLAKSREMERWVEHTHEVIIASQSLLRDIGAAQSLHRDFMLTGDSASYFLRWRQAVSRIDSVSQLLQGLVRDNHEQSSFLSRKILPHIRKQKSKWHGMDYATIVSTHPHPSQNTTLDTIFNEAGHFIEAEEELLSVRKVQLYDAYTVNDIVRWCCLVSICTICLVAMVTVKNQQEVNGQLLSSLEASNLSLEAKVTERTHELTLKNELLTNNLREIEGLNRLIEQNHARLAESLQEVQFLYEYAPCGYHTVDKSGNIEKINKTELEWLGYREEEVVGKMTIEDLLTPTSIEARTVAMEELKARGRVEGFECDMIRKDGTLLPVAVNTIAYFDEQGQFYKNRTTSFNIRERKLLEENLREANLRLIMLNEQKSRFLGIATHDLKNPINSIYGLLDLLRLGGNLSADQRDYITYIEVTLFRMKTLVERLLDLNKLEQLIITPEFQEVRIDELFSGVARDYEQAAAKKQIQFIVDCQVCKDTIYTDRSLLSQILDNLISNAFKFSFPGRRVWARARPAQDGNILFEVEDEGPGISSDDMPKLFGAFQHLSARPTAGESSSGLGLSIVKELARILDTEVSVKSESGKGTLFSFVLPRTPNGG